ncbi:MAG: M23 family metallopeptidase [Candidatus Abyssubacteria bacterium]
MQKKWSVMLVPNSPGRKVYSFDCTTRTIWTAAAVAGSFLLIAFVVVLFMGHRWKQEKLSQISNLESEIQARDAELSELNREFSALRELEDKLRTIAGLKPRERSQSDPEGGKGGPDWEAVSALPEFSSAEFETEAAGQLTVQELLNGSLDLRDSLSEVLDVFETKGAKLSSIPSINPVAWEDAWISSGFGYRTDPINGKRRFHEGCDIVAPRGTPVIAPADGVVRFAGWRDGMGRMIEIEHGFGYVTVYAHNDKLLVKRGDEVRRGQLIGRVGSSGRSTGPHLHYEVRLNGRLVNPYNYVVD